MENGHSLSEMYPERGVWSTPLYMLQDDYLSLSAYNSAASVQLSLAYRFIGKDGRPQVGELHLTPTTARVVSTVRAPLGEGWLTHARINLAAGTPLRGQCYARLGVQKGDGSTGFLWARLIGQYVTSENTPAWPHGRIMSPLEGPGALRSIAGTDPAAGAEISETVPTGARWKLHGLNATLVNAAAAATRVPQLIIDDGTTVLQRIPAAMTSIISDTVVFSWGATGAATSIATVAAMTPIPKDLMMLAAWRVRTLTNALDSGDNWGVPQLFVEEWIEA